MALLSVDQLAHFREEVEKNTLAQYSKLTTLWLLVFSDLSTLNLI
jgi:hypothetical protein